MSENWTREDMVRLFGEAGADMAKLCSDRGAEIEALESERDELRERLRRSNDTTMGLSADLVALRARVKELEAIPRAEPRSDLRMKASQEGVCPICSKPFP